MDKRLIFLSHAGEDVQPARDLARHLRQAGLEVWLDVECLKPGDRWMIEIENGLQQATALVLYVGKSGVRNWVDQEVRVALDRGTKDSNFRLIPLLGPGSDPDALPLFLKQYQWLDLRKGLTEASQLKALIEGATQRLGSQHLEDIARRIFLDLTQLGERSEDTRRRVKKADLLGLGDGQGEAEKILDALSEARLVVVGKETEGREKGDEMAEVAHEALLRDWPRLRRWLDESRDSLRYGRRLAEKAEEWDSSIPKRHSDRLLRGQTLEEALKWAKEQTQRMPSVVQEFLKAGLQEVVVVDQETGLMWTRKDNGEDINWHEANEYAKKLRLGGYSDWRLPTIKELEKLYEPKEGGRYKIRKPFRLTGWWVWSSTMEGSDSAWIFVFVSGERNHYPLAHSLDLRALCVRGPGE
jgi:hypothetical protein